MKNRILIATNNNDKLNEFKDILKTSKDIEFLSLNDLNISSEPKETKKTFEGNALQKAEFFSNLTDIPVISDDSGIEILSLNNFPGIKSKRWKKNKDYKYKCNKLLKKIKNKDNSCRYVCALAYIDKKNNISKVFMGYCNGKLVEYVGDKGFGYDPSFYIERYNKTIGQMNSEEKKTISHRNEAINKFKEFLKIST